MTEAEERALWEKARDGDRAALETLLRTHEQSVYRFGLRMCRDEEAAREVLQNTLLTAFEQMPSFRGDARISTWLYSIARSFCSRHHRRTRSAPTHDVALDSPEAEEGLVVEASASPAELTERAQMAEFVAAAIATLPESQREVVLLRDVEGLSAEEASKVLLLEIPALKSRLHRGRQALRRNLALLMKENGGSMGGQPACPTLSAELEELEHADLDQRACTAIEEHISRCAACKASMGSLEEVTALCRHLPQGDVPAPVKRAVRAALLDVSQWRR